MTAAAIAFWATIIGAACWPVCFWWMHRISSRQDALLKELQEQGQRIEQLSREEHDLIEEVHPEVREIRGDVAEVKDKVKENRST
jgi:hypothetical protein